MPTALCSCNACLGSGSTRSTVGIEKYTSRAYEIDNCDEVVPRSDEASRYEMRCSVSRCAAGRELQGCADSSDGARRTCGERSAKIAHFTCRSKASLRIRVSHLSALGWSPAAGPWSMSPCGCERCRSVRCLVSAELARRVDSLAAPSVRARGEAADLDEGGRGAFRPRRAGIQATAGKRLRCALRAAPSPPSFAPDSIAPA